MQRTDPSSVGYAALERHFQINQFVPSYVLIHSPRNLRTLRALADMEQMAERISQLPDIAMVNGVTRPLGEVPKEFRATYQAGIVGDRLSEGSATINDNMDGLNRLSEGANTWHSDWATSASRSAISPPTSRAWSTRSPP